MTPSTRPVLAKERAAFRADAAFEVLCGTVLMANPLTGPDLGVNGFLVGFVGLLLMVAAVLLGAAGLGKGPFAGRLVAVASINAASGIGCLAWAALGASGAAAILLVLVGAGLLALALFQALAVKRPANAGGRLAPTQEELHAALRGERR